MSFIKGLVTSVVKTGATVAKTLWDSNKDQLAKVAKETSETLAKEAQKTIDRNLKSLQSKITSSVTSDNIIKKQNDIFDKITAKRKVKPETSSLENIPKTTSDTSPLQKSVVPTINVSQVSETSPIVPTKKVGGGRMNIVSATSPFVSMKKVGRYTFY